jgi:hypothetical protein
MRKTYLIFVELGMKWMLLSTLKKVSERLFLNGKWALFQLYHGENKLHDEMMMISVLY